MIVAWEVPLGKCKVLLLATLQTHQWLRKEYIAHLVLKLRIKITPQLYQNKPIMCSTFAVSSQLLMHVKPKVFLTLAPNSYKLLKENLCGSISPLVIPLECNINL